MAINLTSTSKTITLDGYYGHNNFGDDLLMVTCLELVKEIFPIKNIYVKVNSINNVGKLTQHNLHYVLPGKHISTDYYFLGGGGLFFEFNNYDHLWISQAKKIMNYYAKRLLIEVNKRFVQRERNDYEHKYGFCLGIGPFCKYSLREIYTTNLLSQFEAVTVRDLDSLTYCEKWKLNNASLSTDAAFLYPLVEPLKNDSSKKKLSMIGIVVRDWIFDNNQYYEMLIKAKENLQKRGYEIRYISLNLQKDKKVIAYLHSLGEEDILYWDSVKYDIPSFFEKLSVFDLIISARAHGVIAAALLGIPSICIEIEPKLRNIYKMLYPSSLIWQDPFAVEVLVDHVLSIDKKYNEYLSLTIEARDRNITLAISSKEKFFNQLAT